MSRRKIKAARTIITGASSGIGRQLALEMARRGARLVLNARNIQKLKSLQAEIEPLAGQAVICAGDITQPEIRQAVLSTCEQNFAGVDILINNAGVGSVEPFMESSPERLKQIFELNFFAAAELIRLSVPMLEKGVRPVVANVGSVLGHRAVAQKSEYSASKFALHGLSDALRCELAPRGIDVCIISPSTTSSEFWENVLTNDGGAGGSKPAAMSPASVARQAVNAIAAGQHEIIMTLGGKLLVWADRLCPPLMNRLLTRFAAKP